MGINGVSADGGQAGVDGSSAIGERHGLTESSACVEELDLAGRIRAGNRDIEGEIVAGGRLFRVGYSYSGMRRVLGASSGASASTPAATAQSKAQHAEQ